MGTFKEGREYVAGLGDLDESNGRTRVTPQFPGRIYYCFATNSYPFLQRCVKGKVTAGGAPP
jgi:YHYH protein